MKMLQKTHPETHPGSSTNALRRQVLYRCLPIVATAGLMFWLSGGLYPRTWRLFFQACAQFSLLWTQLGAGFLLSFVILAVQALLLAIGWGLLLRLVIREGYALFSAWRTNNAPVPVAPLPAVRGPEPLPPLAVANALQSIQHVAPLSAPSVRPQGATSSQRNMDVLVNPFERAAHPLANPALENPFEEPGSPDNRGRSRGVQRLQEQEQTRAVSATQQKDVPLSAFYEYEEAAQPPAADRQDTPADQRQESEEPGQHVSAGEAFASEGKEEASNPFRAQESEQEQAHFSSVLHELGFFRLNQSSGEGKPALSQPEKEMASLANTSSSTEDTSLAANPFDVQSDVFHLFSPPDVPGQEPEAQISEEKLKEPQLQMRPSPAKMESDQLYLLGNPFEGSLPEVFEQDEDLKHSGLEQVSEELEQRAARRKRATSPSVPGGEKKAAKRAPRNKPD